jgi:hypothetical protein
MLTQEDADTNLPITRSFGHMHVAPVQGSAHVRTDFGRKFTVRHSKHPVDSPATQTQNNASHRLQLLTCRYACEAIGDGDGGNNYSAKQ